MYFHISSYITVHYIQTEQIHSEHAEDTCVQDIVMHSVCT